MVSLEPVKFLSYSTKITATQVEAAYNRLYADSEKFREIVAAMSSEGHLTKVMITNGFETPIGIWGHTPILTNYHY